MLAITQFADRGLFYWVSEPPLLPSSTCSFSLYPPPTRANKERRTTRTASWMATLWLISAYKCSTCNNSSASCSDPLWRYIIATRYTTISKSPNGNDISNTVLWVINLPTLASDRLSTINTRSRVTRQVIQPPLVDDLQQPLLAGVIQTRARSSVPKYDTISIIYLHSHLQRRMNCQWTTLHLILRADC